MEWSEPKHSQDPDAPSWREDVALMLFGIVGIAAAGWTLAVTAWTWWLLLQ